MPGSTVDAYHDASNGGCPRPCDSAHSQLAALDLLIRRRFGDHAADLLQRYRLSDHLPVALPLIWESRLLARVCAVGVDQRHAPLHAAVWRSSEASANPLFGQRRAQPLAEQRETLDRLVAEHEPDMFLRSTTASFVETYVPGTQPQNARAAGGALAPPHDRGRAYPCTASAGATFRRPSSLRERRIAQASRRPCSVSARS
jgi:hypothetical protein